MTFLNPLYSDISPRLTDWLQTLSTGGEVTNLTLDLINRAQSDLIMYRPWEGLVTRTTLTASNSQITLPTDLVFIISVGQDADSNNKIDSYYYKDETYESGYYITDSFNKATGHSRVMTFYRQPNNSIVLVYQKDLADFAGEGTEYSFFPAHLLTLKAQSIHITETGLTGAEINAIENRLQQALNDFTENHQYNNVAPRMRINDTLGNEVFTPSFDLGMGPNIVNRENLREPSRLP